MENLSLDDNHCKPNLLLRRFHGNTVHYLSALSTEKGKNFSPIYDVSLPFSDINRVVGVSCNGVLCLEDPNMDGKLVLWNPSTAHFKLIPESTVQRPISTTFTFFRSSGFGLDPQSQGDDYKVVRFVCNVSEDEEGHYRDSQIQVELYSSKRDSWKEISSPNCCSPFPNPSAYINGIYYWVSNGRSNNNLLLLAFDFSTETFSTLLLPDVGKPLQGSSAYNYVLVEFDGLLGLIVFPKMGTKKAFDLWVMRNESWTRQLVIHVPDAERPLGFYTKDKLFFEGINRELLLFDLATLERKNLGIFDYARKMKLIPYAVSSNHSSDLEEPPCVTRLCQNNEAYSLCSLIQSEVKS